MLDHVEQQEHVDPRQVELQGIGVEVADDDRGRRRHLRGSDAAHESDTALPGFELLGQMVRTGAQAHHPAARRHRLQRVGVARGIAELGHPVRVVVVGSDVVLPLVEDPRPMCGIAQRGQGHVPGVGQPVHPGDLVSVEGGNRQLDDARPGVEQLEDDLGVEVEVVGVQLQREVGQGRHSVEAVAGSGTRRAGFRGRRSGRW